MKFHFDSVKDLVAIARSVFYGLFQSLYNILLCIFTIIQPELIIVTWYRQKQSSRGVPRKKCSENMQQIYRRTPMPKFDFLKSHFGMSLSCKFAVYFRNTLGGSFCIGFEINRP